MAVKLHDYSSIADIQSFWLSEIAPQYFDFNDVNLYKAGSFGYINEVMSTVTADVFNSVNIAKREFYSATAQNLSSFYKLAGDYDVDIPMVVPASCTAAIFVLESDILNHGTISDGTYTFILDNKMEIMADDIQFSLDYPIRIMARYINGAYSYTTYYDTARTNSINSTVSKYIQNKSIVMNNTKYLVMQVTLHQYTMASTAQVVTKNSDIETVSLIFQHEGNLAGFDVFYTENPGTSVETHIPAFTANELTPSSAYVIYELLNDNKIRFTFPKNAYFSPKLNSEVRCCIYESSGADGNFDEFLGDLNIVCDSDDYAYNKGLSVRGTVIGSCAGGKAQASQDDFIREIREKNCTNGTLTNSTDLSLFFNNIVDDDGVRVEFSKSRDDALQRVHSAFILLKDDSDNVIPTNSCNLLYRKNDFDVFESGRGVIKPGKIFKYSTTNTKAIELSDLSLSEDLDKYDSGDTQEFLFTNPFLICVSVENGIVGYYGNSISEIKQTEFTFVEDRSFNQFICLGLQVNRNPIAGESFYTFTAKISPSAEMDPELLISVPDTTTEVIRAKSSGRVIEKYFEDGAVWCKVEYNTVSTVDADKYEIIQISTYNELVNGEFIYHTGYEMQFDILETFVQDDVLAIKKVTDKGKLRANLDLNGVFGSNGLYIPMHIEAYDESKGAYTLNAYISTNDFISLNQTVVLDYGIYSQDGTPNNYVSVPMEDLSCIISIFYKNDTLNYAHEYSTFEYFKNYTLTNQYTTSAANTISLIKGISFIRSNLKFIDTFSLDTITAAYDGRIDSMEFDTETKNIYYNIKYAIDDESLMYDKILYKKFVLDESTGTSSYEIEYQVDFEVGDYFTAGTLLASKRIYDGDDETNTNYLMQISMMPIVKSNWIKDTANFSSLINKVYMSYDALFEAYFQLENQYGINMAFFNTYGVSNRYQIGNYHKMQDLDSVNCSISVGIELTAMTNSSLFIEKYRTYIKDAIESLNDLDESGKAIYIIDLLGASKDEFPEIVHLEYYGFNGYDQSAQIITPKTETVVTTSTVEEYVPEFINIYTYKQNDVNVPKIDIRLINYTAVS